MEDYFKSAYFSAGFFKDLAYYNDFKLVDSVEDCDELDQYIMSRFDKLFGDLIAPQIFKTYILNLYRAFCTLTCSDNPNSTQILSQELSEDRMVLEDAGVLDMLNQFVRYSCYFRYTCFDGWGSRKQLHEQCSDISDKIKEVFDNPKDWWFYAGKMLLNSQQSVENNLNLIEAEKGIEHCYQYCKVLLEDYEDLYKIAPKYEEEAKAGGFIYEDSSYLYAEDKEEIENIIDILKDYITTYENNKKHPSLEDILKDCEKLKSIRAIIQKAIEYGCIRFKDGGKIGEDGLLIPVIKQGNNTFPSDSAFAYFIGTALHLKELNKNFPQEEVQHVFGGKTKSGKPTDWASYWRNQNKKRYNEALGVLPDYSPKLVSNKTIKFVDTLLAL